MTTKQITLTEVRVDDYLAINKEIAELTKQQNKLKESLRNTMNEEGWTELHGTQGKVYLNPAKATNSSSRYTDYELKDVMTLLEGKDLKKVTEIRVNADKLTKLMKHDIVGKQSIEAIKQVRAGTPRFTVKRN